VKRFVNLFGTNSIRTAPTSKPRKFKPGFEHLEDRIVQTVGLATSLLASTSVNPAVYATSAPQATNLTQTSVAPNTAVQGVLNPTIMSGLDSPGPGVPILPIAQGLTYNDQGVVAIETYVAAHPELGTPFLGHEGTIAPTPTNDGLVIWYYNGTSHSVVLWSPATAATGAHAVTGAILDKYLSPQLGGEAFGYPTADATSVTSPDGEYDYVRQDFLGTKPGVYGAIVDYSGRGVFEVHGAIYQEWLHSPIQGLIPVSDETEYDPPLTANRGFPIRYNGFVDPATGHYWDIAYVDGDANAHLVESSIFDKWLSLGGTNYGRPTANTAWVTVPQTTINGPGGLPLTIGGTVYTQEFAGGPNIGSEFGATITSTPWSGVHEMHGVVRDVYSGDGVNHFGFNITDETWGVSPYTYTQDLLRDGQAITWQYNITLDPKTGQFYRIYALASTGTEGDNTDSWEYVTPEQAVAAGVTFQTSSPLTSAPSMLGTIASAEIPASIAFPPPDTFTSAASGIPAIAFSPSGNTSFATDPWDMSPASLASLAGMAQPAPVADLTNVSFTVISDDGTVSHQLVIQSQVAQADGSATFNGVWDPAGADLAVTGTLTADPDGSIHLIFSAADGSNFDSVVSGQASAYHIDGTLTPGDGSAPVHLAGDQDQAQPAAVTPVADLTNISFALTDDNSVAHQLQIQTQTANPDGSATFTGLWDGSEQVNGTLAYDASGNLQMTFAGNTDSLDGTVTTGAVGYHLDGILTSSDGSSVHVAGDQAVAQINPVADFTNVQFALTDDNGVAHQLQVQAQTGQPDGSALFSGTWDGQTAAGTLAYDAAGNVHITFSAGSDSLEGTITGTAGAYHLDGIITGSDGSTVHVAGDQAVAQINPVADFTNVNFAMVDDSGTAHQLQIQTQTANPDGTATFTGVWNGEVGTGTLAYDATGNIHITFSSADYTFDGTISGAAGAYQIDGTVALPGVDPLHVAGAQA
jgi:hypothetical protein